MQTTNPLGQRRQNLAVVARAIWQKPGITRRELTERFDINESSISRLTGQLIDMGLVESLGTLEGSTAAGPNPGGRKRIGLQIRPDFGQVWGLTLWRDRMRISLTNIQGDLLAAEETAVEGEPAAWPDCLAQAMTKAQALVHRHSMAMPLLGLGIGLPGRVDSQRGIILFSDEFGLKDEPCPLLFGGNLPVLWENDANCGAWCGIHTQSRDCDELFVLGRFLENGPLGLPDEFSVGFGLIFGGQLQRGWRHNAGEFLSALWEPGNRIAFGVDEKTFGHSRSNPQAFRATAADLLRNLRFASRLLDPRRILLGGDLKEHYQEVLNSCDGIGWSPGKELLVPLEPDRDEISLGAAWLVLDQLFQTPDPRRFTLFQGYGTGTHDPVWRGRELKSLSLTGEKLWE